MTSRLDAWDVGKTKDYRPVKCGYAEGFLQKDALGKELGRGGLGVVRAVHIIMELCTGGPLAHSLARRHYSERTVRAL